MSLGHMLGTLVFLAGLFRLKVQENAEVPRATAGVNS